MITDKHLIYKYKTIDFSKLPVDVIKVALYRNTTHWKDKYDIQYKLRELTTDHLKKIYKYLIPKTSTSYRCLQKLCAVHLELVVNR